MSERCRRIPLALDIAMSLVAWRRALPARYLSRSQGRSSTGLCLNAADLATPIPVLLRPNADAEQTRRFPGRGQPLHLHLCIALCIDTFYPNSSEPSLATCISLSDSLRLPW